MEELIKEYNILQKKILEKEKELKELKQEFEILGDKIINLNL